MDPGPRLGLDQGTATYRRLDEPYPYSLRELQRKPVTYSSSPLAIVLGPSTSLDPSPIVLLLARYLVRSCLSTSASATGL